MNETAELLTVRQVARDLHVSKVTLYRAIDRGELPAVRLGVSGPLRISQAALERYLRPASERKDAA